MSSMTPISFFFRAFSVFVCISYSSFSRVNLYLMEVCLMPVALGGIMGSGPGLGFFSKLLVYKVMYTIIYTVSVRKPSLPSLSGICIDSVLYDIWYIWSTIVS